MCPAITKRFWILLVLLLFVPVLLLGEGAPPAEQHFQKGLKYYLNGENKAAVSELNQSLQINPSHEQAQALLALISGKQEISQAPTEVMAPAIKTEGAKLLSLELKNADLNDVLRLFAQEYGFNIVAGKEVAGTVTISFSNIPVEEALRAILAVNGFGYEKSGSLMLVSTLTNLSSRNNPLTTDTLITRVFTLNYVSAEKIKEIIQKQLSPGGTVDVMTDLSVGGWSMSGVSTTGTTIGKKTREATANEEKPKVLVVVDSPKVLAKIETLINQLDVKPSQILIEAMIVEISSDYIRDIGINWGPTTTNGLTSGLTTLTSPAFPVPAMSAGGGLSLTYDNNHIPLNVTIQALEKSGKANILSNPRIMALDNYPAAIMVGERYPIMTTTTTTDTTGKTLITGSLDHYEPIGISLRVIPHVNQAGAVEMILHPEVTSLGDSVASGTGDGTLVLPRINNRESDTNVTVRSGQTVVIGGLLTNQTKDTAYKVPFFGDIPIFGYLFKRTVKEP
ncbi:MAG: secretin N-terminal domain-containing protein, partial [Candidatus Ratteibacteria bacterium]